MKTENRLLEIFIKIYEIFLYSLILPISAGIIILFIAPIAKWFVNLDWIIKVPVSIVVGICLMICRNRLLKKKQNNYNRQATNTNH